MKKVFLLGAAALFSLALVSSCSDDEDQTCIQCMDADNEVELEYCYEEGNLVQQLAKASEFYTENLGATCEE